MKDHLKKVSCLILLVLSFFIWGCGGSNNENSFVAQGSANETVPPESAGNATLTLESTLELERSISKSVTSLKFRTFNSVGKQIFSSPVISKAPQVKVDIPIESKDVKIDYLDDSGFEREIWGSPIPPLELKEEIVIREPNPDSAFDVVRLAVEGPTTLAAGIPTQFRVRVFYLGGASTVVSSSANWSMTGGTITGSGLATAFQPNLSSTNNVTITASFGRVVSPPFTSAARVIAPVGAPFFANQAGDLPINSLRLDGFGESQQLHLFSEFADGVRREITTVAQYASNPANVVSVNALGTVTAIDAGTTVILGTYLGRQGALNVEVGQDFFSTVFENFSVLPGTVGGLSSAFRLLDLNGDGRVDIAGLPSAGSGIDFTRVAIHLGNGDGTFRPASFVSLPLSANSSASPVILSIKDPNSGLDRLIVGNSSQALAAVVEFNGQSPRSRGLNLSAPSKEFHQLYGSGAELLVRMTDNQMLRFFRAPGTIQLPFTGSDTLQIADLDLDEHLNTVDFGPIGNGIIFHQQARSSAERSEVRYLRRTGPTTFVQQNAFPSGRIVTSLATPGAQSAEIIAAGNDTFRLRNSGNGVSSQRFSAPANTTQLTAFEVGSARRIRATLASGGASVSLVDGTIGNIDGFPTGTFDRFESADLTGDGTFDLASWRNGVISITQLAVRP